MPTEILILLAVTFCIAVIFIPPYLLFRPLIQSIADRIAGRYKGGVIDEIKVLRHRLSVVENELADFKGRMLTVEESADFSRKLLEAKPAEKAGESKKSETSKDN